VRGCKEVSELMSQALDRELRPGERLAVRVHALACRGCGRLERQLRFLRAAARAYAGRGLASPPLRLSAQARARIRARLAREA
jgi:hypothetical protein